MCKTFRTALGHTQTPIIGFRCFPPRIKRPESDNRALPSRAKVLNDWSYTSALFICLYGVDIKKFPLEHMVLYTVIYMVLYTVIYKPLLVCSLLY